MIVPKVTSIPWRQTRCARSSDSAGLRSPGPLDLALQRLESPISGRSKRQWACAHGAPSWYRPHRVWYSPHKVDEVTLRRDLPGSFNKSFKRRQAGPTV